MTAYYNDIDPYCCKVLRKNIKLGYLPKGDVDERDIRTVDASELAGYGQIHLFAGIGGLPLGMRWGGMPDDFPIITGGFPCQPHSVAGKRKSSEDERDLWGEYARIIRTLRLEWLLAENVPGLLSSEAGRFFGGILRELAQIGYDAEWEMLSAAAFGAWHLRERIWIVAHTDQFGWRTWGAEHEIRQRELRIAGSSGTNADLKSEREWGLPIRSRRSQQTQANTDGGDKILSDPGCLRLEKPRNVQSEIRLAERNWWAIEPGVGRMVYGLPHRMDRIRGLGNAVVPQVVAYIASRIMEATYAD